VGVARAAIRFKSSTANLASAASAVHARGRARRPAAPNC